MVRQFSSPERHIRAPLIHGVGAAVPGLLSGVGNDLRPVGGVMALEVELAYFAEHKIEWLRHYEGKFAVIVGQELLGIFDTAERAYRQGISQRGNVPMLIKKIERDELPEALPAMTLGLIGASS